MKSVVISGAGTVGGPGAGLEPLAAALGAGAPRVSNVEWIPGIHVGARSAALCRDHDLAADDPIRAIATQVKEVLDSESVIATRGQISQPCADCGTAVPFWRHELNRNRFSFDAVVGQIDKVEVLCGYGAVSLAFKPDVVWSVNKDWGECDIRVTGKAGTSLRLVEHQPGG